MAADTSRPWTAERFEALYGAERDPWRMEGSWYEQRKRALVLASLPRARFSQAFEPGCGEGLLTRELAPRCERLLAWDCSASALATAQARVPDGDAVQFGQGGVPAQWPAGPFDLVVLSELLYYLPGHALDHLAAQVRATLMARAVVLACHWKHPIAGCAWAGAQVHARLDAALGLQRATTIDDADFVLDVWVQGAGASIAAAEHRL